MPTLSVLSPRALNRATLARQRLLERVPLDVVDAVDRVGGLQAQEPASPFVALWSRLAPFDAASLRAAFENRRLVKATLMRGTLHAVSARDYRLLAPAMAPLIESAYDRATRGTRPPDDVLARFTAAARDLAATPRSNRELRDLLGPIGAYSLEATWWWVRRHVALVHVPSDTAWAFGRQPRLVAADAWLPADGGFAGRDEGIAHLVRRYLAAFGPSTLADLVSWSRLPAALLRPAVDALEATGGLVHARDERGRALVDLPGAPRPDPDTPAPPRLLPMWDSVLLAHADRTRIVDDADRARLVAINGDHYPSFLVDGRVAGLWWAHDSGSGTRIELEAFRPIAPADRTALEEEAHALEAFVQPHEPEVYRRYRRSRERMPTRPVRRTAAGGQDLRRAAP